MKWRRREMLRGAMLVVLASGVIATGARAENRSEYQPIGRGWRCAEHKISITKKKKLKVGKTAQVRIRHYRGDAIWQIQQRRETVRIMDQRPGCLTIFGLNSGTAKVSTTIGDRTYTCRIVVTEHGEKLSKKEEEKADSLSDSVYLEYAPGNMEAAVVDDIELVNKLSEHWKVVWESSKPSVVSSSGRVRRDHKNHKVMMSAVVRKGGKKYRINYLIQVVAVTKYRPEDIEDLCIEDLDKMNKGDIAYYCAVNDYGYLNTVFGKYSPVRVDSYESALYSLYSVRTLLGLMDDPLTDLVPYQAEISGSGQMYRFTQKINGVESFDHMITVGCDKNGITDYLFSSYNPMGNK